MHEEHLIELTIEEYELARLALKFYLEHLLEEQEDELTARIVMDLIEEKFNA